MLDLRTIALVILSALLGVIVMWSVLYLIGDVGGTIVTTIVQSKPEPWLRQYFSIVYYGIQLFGWLPPLVICAAIIREFAGARAGLCGLVAGLFGIVFLFAISNLAAIQSGGTDKGMLDFALDHWGRGLLLLLVLPLMCTFRFRHVA